MSDLIGLFRLTLTSAREKLVRQNLIDRVEARKLLVWIREMRLVYGFWECF
jgi:hypothetical protein